jgi:ASC-1-like (ASCH) protein
MIMLSLMPCYFELIKSGKKTVEGRIYTPKFEKLAQGDHTVFVKNGTEEKLVCSVKALNIYKNFSSMLLAEGIENMLPGVATLSQAVQMYEDFPGYKDKVKQY